MTHMIFGSVNSEHDSSKQQVAANDNERLLRLDEVLRLIPVSRANFYRNIRKGLYPKPVKLGARAVAWRMSDIVALMRDGTAE